MESLGQQLLAQGSELLIILSPHWRTAKMALTSHEAPTILHDFYGFPKALYQLRPDITGAPGLAEQLALYLGQQGWPVDLHPQQGFDHGAWVPYLHLFPQGGPRLLQLSMPVGWTGVQALKVGLVVGEFARAHQATVVGSGSLTHNFNDMNLGQPLDDGQHTPDYVNSFTDWITQQLLAGNKEAIAHAEHRAPEFSRAHPDEDHYLPLPFAMGAASKDAVVQVLPKEVRYQALSLQSYAFRTAG